MTRDFDMAEICRMVGGIVVVVLHDACGVVVCIVELVGYSLRTSVLTRRERTARRLANDARV